MSDDVLRNSVDHSEELGDDPPSTELPDSPDNKDSSAQPGRPSVGFASVAEGAPVVKRTQFGRRNSDVVAWGPLEMSSNAQAKVIGEAGVLGTNQPHRRAKYARSNRSGVLTEPRLELWSCYSML